jgi:autotransporter-associated beta strand protein
MGIRISSELLEGWMSPRCVSGRKLAKGALVSGSAVAALLVGGASSSAQTFTVSNAGQLVNAITNADATSGAIISFASNVTLTGTLPTISSNVTINGNGHRLSGANSFQGFFAASGAVAINNLTIANAASQGGAGGAGPAGGGGGAGLGGALFVGQNAAVTLSNIQFVANSATGGTGGLGAGHGGPGGGAGGLGPHGFGNGGAGNLSPGPETFTGFGGGGGGPGNLSLFGGGQGGSFPLDSGGGGGAFGGAIFVQQGGSLPVNGSLSISGGSLTAGAGGDPTAPPGFTAGTGIFFQGTSASLGTGTTFTFQSSNGQVQTISDSIADTFGAADVFGPTITGVSGEIGSLNIVKAGAGTLVFSSSNIYTGTTIVSAGTLQAGAANAFSPFSAHFVAAGATLDLNGFDQAILTLSGAGNVTLGSATLTTGGNFTVLGNSPRDSEFSGVISGSGGLTKVGTGTFTLSGASTYSGTTTISAGTLQLGDGTNAGSVAGPISDNAALVFNTGGNVTIVVPSAISGTGTVTQIGGGTVVLDGVSTFSQPLALNAGTLEVGDANNPGASITSDVTVSAGGTLAGHGSVFGAVSNIGGIVAPGGSIGTLTVNSYAQSASGTLQVEVTPSAASQLHVTGQANLAGTVSLIFDPGSYSSKTFPILTAGGGITGNFTALNSTLAASSLSQSVVKNAAATEVDLVLSGSATVTPPVPPPTPVNPPPISTAPTPTPTPTPAPTPQPSAPIVIAPTNDTIWTALATAAIEQSHDTSAMIFDRLRSMHAGGGSISAGASPRQQAFAAGPESLDEFIAQAPANIESNGGWFRAVGNFTSVDGNGVAPTFQANGGGFLAGIDRPIADNAIVGLAAGYIRTAVTERTGADGTRRHAIRRCRYRPWDRRGADAARLGKRVLRRPEQRARRFLGTRLRHADQRRAHAQRHGFRGHTRRRPGWCRLALRRHMDHGPRRRLFRRQSRLR